MDNKLKNTENEAQIIKKEDLDHHHNKGIYMSSHLYTTDAADE